MGVADIDAGHLFLSDQTGANTVSDQQNDLKGARTSDLPSRIGLCLSGGGFRAAAFHLGTLTYLQRVGLLERVRVLSTVSGGTFTGAKYALSCVEKTPPETFFRQYYEELRKSDIFPQALRILADGCPLSNSSGRKDIITCAAQSYSETFFRRQLTDAPALFGDLLNRDTAPLEEIIFNSTDFRKGYAFRFQKAATGKIGNGATEVSKEDAANLRIGDIVAASSCFPAGFEPIEFPGDFTWQNGMPAALQTLPATPLMDGGIYDNEGLESLMLSVKRNEAAGIDMIITSDTDRNADSLYQMPPSAAVFVKHNPDAKVNWSLLAQWNPSLGKLAWISWVLMLLGILSIIALGVNFCLELGKWLWGQQPNRPSLTWLALTNLVPWVATAGTTAVLVLLRSLFKNQLLSRVPQLQTASWDLLRHVKIFNAIDMIALRVSSLIALASNIFMKRIRSAGYGAAYQDPAYLGKLVANYIYSVDSQTPWTLQHPETDGKMLPGLSPGLIAEISRIPGPTDAVHLLVDTAARLPTLLWFQNDRELPDLVAAGQITTCVNLMKFIARTRVFDDAKNEFADAAVQQLWVRLKEDWAALRADPRVFAKPLASGTTNV